MQKPEEVKIRIEEGDKPSQLYLDAVRARPLSSDTQTLLTASSQRLESLAAQLKLSVAELLNKAETESQFREEYLEALTLARRIAKLKQLR